MNENHFLSPPAAYLEFRQSSLKALRGREGLELPLERTAGGGLTTDCRQKLIIRLRSFLKKEFWQPRPRVWCAIAARGVSLRRLTLPATTNESLKRLLALQIESEFPLPPDALAWGYRQLPDESGVRNAESGMKPSPDSALRTPHSALKQEVLVVAVKKEVVQEYSEILSECGVVPVFTVAALARRYVCPELLQSCALLDVGRNYSELISYEDGVPLSVRVLPWGGESVTLALAKLLGTSRDQAEQLKLQLSQQSPVDAALAPKIQAALDTAVDSFARVINGNWNGQKVYLAGRSAQLKDFAPQLARRLGNGTKCQLLELDSGEGRSAAVLGLRTVLANSSESALVTLQSEPANGSAALARPASWKWAGIALGLALACLAVPYLEPLVLKRRLSRKLTAIQSDRARLVTIDRELDFLRYLKGNQPPYLDAVYLLAKAAPPGSRFDSLSMNRRGDLALRGSMKDGQQVAGFRTKLIDSGFFASVAVEEQTPTPDRQKVTVRMTAQWKPTYDRQSLAIGPTAEDLEKAKNRPTEPPPGAFPPMGMPAAAPIRVVPQSVAPPGPGKASPPTPAPPNR